MYPQEKESPGASDHLGQIHWNRCPSCSAAAMHLDHTIPSQPAGTGQPRLPSTARPPPALLHKSPGQARHTAPWGGVPKTRHRTLGPGGTRMRGEGGQPAADEAHPSPTTHNTRCSTFHSSIFCRSSPVIHPSSSFCFKLPSRDHLSPGPHKRASLPRGREHNGPSESPTLSIISHQTRSRPVMKQRKPHSKSRRGCLQCKRRHVKVRRHGSTAVTRSSYHRQLTCSSV
jgi:hypothetical protein